jgi:biopolymer transport protein ExbD
MAVQLAGRAAARRFSVNQNHDINVTPFIDVMLVLLIVFIIAAPLATTAINVDIAAGNGGGPITTPVTVMIDDRGAISLQSASVGPTPTSLQQLGRDVAWTSGSAGADHSWIVIRGAAHTRYGAFMAVLDQLHADGFTDVTLADRTG